MSILFVSTSANKLGVEHKTGLWLEEFAIPYMVLKTAGHEITVASPLGGQIPLDPKTEPNDQQRAEWAPALAALQNTEVLSRLPPVDWKAIVIPGGHGPLVDLADDHALANLLRQQDARKGLIAAVCHGPAGLLSAKNANGISIIQGRKISGFSNMEERLALLHDVVPFLLEDRLKEAGASYDHTLIPFHAHIVEDGHFITGQNPASSEPLAKRLLERLAERP